MKTFKVPLRGGCLRRLPVSLDNGGDIEQAAYLTRSVSSIRSSEPFLLQGAPD